MSNEESYEGVDETVDTNQQIEDLTRIVGEYEELFEEQEKKIKELEAQISQRPQSQPVAQQLSQDDLREQWNQRFYENPSEATYALIQSTLQSYMPIINQQVQPAMDQIRRNSTEEVRRAREDFNKYEASINEILKSFSPQSITPSVVDAAYLVAKGYDTFGDYKSAMIEGSSGYSEEGEEITDLTPAQRKIAKRFGIREEDYLARIKRIEERKRRRENI
ncbi:MAG: hypothetical protein DDT23_00624 [candidate division WS2 bacterium]|nr:hypothetical protein [Candidatus Lithacetigena glycinireducens]